jgi:putative chitinase
MSRSAPDWVNILTACGVRNSTALHWAPVFVECIQDGTFSAGDADIEGFLSQVLHESARLEVVEENLNYSTERLMAIWPARFPTHAGAQLYARNPQALANKVYGGRLGNTEPGAGWKYRGRGLLQCTGRDNYAAVGKTIGADLVGNPDLMTDPKYALLSAIAFWEKNIPDTALGNVQRETKLVNGGTVGLAERIALAEIVKDALA